MSTHGSLGEEDLPQMSTLKTPKKSPTYPNSPSSGSQPFSPSSSQPPMSPSLERLMKAKETLNNLKSNLKEDMESKKEIEESRFYEFRELMGKLEKTINLEMKRRAEGDKFSQTMFEGKLSAIQEAFEKKITEKFSQVQLSAEMLNKRIVQLEKELQEEKDKTKKFCETLQTTTVAGLEELKNMIESEKVNRLEKEAQILKKVSEDFTKVNERFDASKKATEGALNTLKQELKKKEVDTSKSDQLFRQQAMQDIENLKILLKNEMEDRQHTEEQMSQSIDQIVGQIHESLKLVSKGN